MTKKLLICSLILLLLLTTPCLAATEDTNAMIAVALYIDTADHYIPGMDLLNKALNEVIRFKVNALFLGSEVHSGNEVLRGLKRNGIISTASATPEALAAYAQSSYVNYVMLFTVNPIDISLQFKAFSAANDAYLADKSVSRPDGSEALSTVDTLTTMIGEQLTFLSTIIHPDKQQAATSN